ncbi:IclR family transcriptional regulator [Phaeobacter inhibens]|uniref:IclR family transcriptional regulator n=1 Tax=Phaeobacter inhibens TaxID=221822 RepID=UPI0021A4DB25|nr:IclR family transcriptional regulator [Phaeobacter inhibens]UWR41482.1 IclR family transcriptional regulator [Phaeobacter inhibens]UWR50623.1 IclR family transcriptional regulator [Phaeobacter inhibens]UWR97645.1 IclR family transcriptional regulator [Phaeobacter inhibens]UWS05578.1 IclR family transcriptional regulator [Phaeobacter inhibens]
MDSDNTASADGEKDRNFVTALARGLDVLRAFRRNELELTNTDLAERTGLPKPTVSRLTYTLCQLGYLIQDPQSGSYRLGAGVLRLGYGVLAGMDISDRASQILRDLRNGKNSYITSALGEAHHADVIYIAVHRSREDVSLAAHVGMRLPLFFSAVGRAILAGMSPDQRAESLKIADALDPDGRLSRQDSLGRAQDEYAARGFCTGYGDWRPDVNGIAVPVVSLNGMRVYGLNVGGPSFHVSPNVLETIYADQLMSAAETLSMRP